ncbi:hypothetical protein [Hymenobacter nivis]|uniref:Uncharacterized protein n=1 Tax=Hymenobacter nivis TaxID=1850093 RepID=A0A502HEB3_9BACT|nr:hypothetical protein [Hymenobacter nivis]TPG72012.1 hypothetical protein EAH73_01840 [Hymenobacter nivis]
MGPSNQVDAVVRALEAALTSGALALVDEDGQPLTLAEAYDRPTWAHLRDAADGQVHVQALRAGRELLAPRYLELLGMTDFFNADW